MIEAREYLGIPGGISLNLLTNHANYPDNPDVIAWPAWFEWPTSDDIFTPPVADVKNQYGVLMQGYIHPPTTGDYVFYLASDDQGRLFLSTDEDPANRVLIAEEPEWNPVRAFTSETRRPLLDAGTQFERRSNVSRPIRLEAGRAYYVEAMMKEEGGGDNLAVAWKMPGDDWDPEYPIEGQYLSAFGRGSGAPGLLSPIDSQTVGENLPVSFRADPSGTPPYEFQWLRNGTEIPDATGLVYTIESATAADNNAQYSVRITGPAGTFTSPAATLTVQSDTTPPTIAGVTASSTFNSVTVTFSEPVEAASATTVGNYALSGGLTISAATQTAPDRVILTTSNQAENTPYTLTVNNIRDQAATPNVIAANTTATFSSFTFVQGMAQAEFYDDIGGTSIENNLRTSEKFPDFPDRVQIFPRMEIPTNARDNYGARLTTFFTPDATGNYVFFIASDDNGELWLSTDANPANKRLIAVEPEWNPERAWLNTDRRPGMENRSDWYWGTEWPTGNTITLNAGTRYYMEALMKEGGGGDNLAVTVIREGDPDPANGSPALTGNRIGVFMDPGQIPPVYVSHTPTTEQRVALGSPVTLTAEFQGPGVTVHWQYNNQDVPGATGASYTIPSFGAGHAGLWRAVGRNAGGSANSPLIFLGPELVAGTLFIEAEDFNFGRGDWIRDQPIGMTGPYPGGAYQDLGDGLGGFVGDGSDLGVDYFEVNTGSDQAVYRPFTGVEAGKRNGPAGLDRGTFNVEVNHVVGWTANGEWMNYTRNWPAGDNEYFAFGRISSGGAAPNAELGLVTSPANTENQTVQKLGEFRSIATANWDVFTFVPLRNEAGAVQTVRLSGEQTVRYTWLPGEGDVDYLAFIPVGDIVIPGEGARLTAARDGNNLVITWTESGTLQQAPDATGPWTAVAGATGNSHTVAITGERMFFRVVSP